MISKIADEIENFIASRQGVSFAELEREFPEHFNGDHAVGFAEKNIWFWWGLSSEFADALIQLLDEKRIIAEQCTTLIYMVDGMMPQRQLAKQNRNYKGERWLPVVFSTVRE